MCFGLINYYKSKYDEIYVLIRSDAKELVDYYVRNLDGVNIIYIDTDHGRFYGNIDTNTSGDNVEYINGGIKIPTNFDVLFHGEHDRFRKDEYKQYWYRPNHLKKPANHFSEMFYTFYDIDFLTRIDSFSVDRDLQLEENVYNGFIGHYGIDYVIYHDDEENHTSGVHHVSTKIDFEDKINGCSYVNLNKQSNTFFDYIRVIQGAKEIHLVDSIWGCLLYQLDAKYGILKDKTINLYCKRGHENLFQYPIKLDNWNLIK